MDFFLLVVIVAIIGGAIGIFNEISAIIEPVLIITAIIIVITVIIAIIKRFK